MIRANIVQTVSFGFISLYFHAAAIAQISTPRLSDTSSTQQLIQAYQQFQEQQQATLGAVEQARQETAATARAVQTAREEAEIAAKHNAETLEARLKEIEQAVSVQRAREMETIQKSHRFMLVIIAVFAGVAFFGMLFFAAFLLRSLNQRAEALVAHGWNQPLTTRFAAAGALSAGETSFAVTDPAQQASTRFLTTIERLEKRIQEMELASSPLPPPADANKTATPPTTASANVSASASQDLQSEPANAPNVARAALLLGKGQTLLNLQQADTALSCFDDAIALDPANPEAFIRKGAALEKLGQLDAAIDSYDRAIALDTSMTMAYLCKGGVFNRLERYSEALQCYEQALRVQQKVGVS